MNSFEWISLIGSIASIVGLILYFLDKKGKISINIPLKYLVFLISLTIISIGISIWKNQTTIEVKQGENNDGNEINIELTE